MAVSQKFEVRDPGQVYSTSDTMATQLGVMAEWRKEFVAEEGATGTIVAEIAHPSDKDVRVVALRLDKQYGGGVILMKKTAVWSAQHAVELDVDRINVLEEKVDKTHSSLQAVERIKFLEEKVDKMGASLAEKSRHLESLEKKFEEEVLRLEKEAAAATACHMESLEKKFEEKVLRLTEEADAATARHMESLEKRFEEAAARADGLQRQLDERHEAILGAIHMLDKKHAFFTIYKCVPAPASVDELMEGLKTFVHEVALKNGVPDTERDRYLDKVREDAKVTEGDLRSRPNRDRVSEVGHAGCRLWTLDERLFTPSGAKGLYHMLCAADREGDERLLVRGGVLIQKAINASLVSRGLPRPRVWPQPLEWEVPNVSFRGSGIPDEKLEEFWKALMDEPDRRYRVPMPLASSIKRSTAERFLDSAQHRKVLFKLTWPQSGCQHASYIESMTAVSGEAEILLAPFSALRVTSFPSDFVRNAGTTVEIGLAVLDDNKAAPEHLRLSEWH